MLGYWYSAASLLIVTDANGGEVLSRYCCFDSSDVLEYLTSNGLWGQVVPDRYFQVVEHQHSDLCGYFDCAQVIADPEGCIAALVGADVDGFWASI